MEVGLCYLVYGKKVFGIDDLCLLVVGYYVGYGCKELK